MDEWIDPSDLPTTADERWLQAVPTVPESSTEQPSSWAPRNLADMEDVPPIEPTLGSLGLVYPGKRHVFSGPQESAKTLAAYVIGLQVVRAGSRVVLIDFEMGPWDTKTRLRELGATDDELGGFLYVEPSTPATANAVGELVGLEPSLVIVDAAAGAFQLESLNDNDRGDVEKWAGAWVAPFWRVGIATIVLDHVTKNAETRGNYAIGSERKVGGADVHLGFSVITPIRRGGHGKYQITTHKDRGGHLKRGKLATFELSSDPETHSFTWEFVPAPLVDEEHPFRPSGLMEKVSRYLETSYEPQSKNKVENGIKGKTDYKRAAIALLIEEEYVSQTDAGLVSLRPFREDDELTHLPSPLTSPHLAPFSDQNTSPLRPSPIGGARAGEGGGEGRTQTDIPF